MEVTVECSFVEAIKKTGYTHYTVMEPGSIEEIDKDLNDMHMLSLSQEYLRAVLVDEELYRFLLKEKYRVPSPQLQIINCGFHQPDRILKLIEGELE